MCWPNANGEMQDDMPVPCPGCGKLHAEGLPMRLCERCWNKKVADEWYPFEWDITSPNIAIVPKCTADTDIS
jgi:hypothetical protein